MRERIEDLGRLREKINQILDLDVLDDHFLSKHNETEWYPSALEKWKEDREGLIQHLEEKLDDCRRSFLHIQDKLWDCFAIAKGDSDEE